MNERQDVFVALSQSEWEVLRLSAGGALDQEVADRLGIRFTTVRTHVRRIFWKVSVRNRAAAVAWYCQQPACPPTGIR